MRRCALHNDKLIFIAIMHDDRDNSNDDDETNDDDNDHIYYQFLLI